MEKELKDKLENAKLEDILTFVYVLVDDIYLNLSHYANRPGITPTFTDSEVITLSLVNQMFSNSEASFHRFVKRNYLHLFPNLTDRTRYHRRCKSLSQITNLIRLDLLQKMDAHLQIHHVIDSMPVPVCVYARAARNLNFACQFNIDNDSLYGHCAAKNMDYYGMKLHLMVTTQGIPVHFVLAPAAHHDVVIAPELVESYRQQIAILGDKGYVGIDKRLQKPVDYQFIVQKRENQKVPNTEYEKTYLALFRQTIETTNAQLAGQFNIQFTRAKSAWGLCSRVIHKITAHTMAIFLNFLADRPLLEIKNLVL